MKIIRSLMIAITITPSLACAEGHSYDYQVVKKEISQAIISYEFPGNIFTREISSGLPNIFHVYFTGENRDKDLLIMEEIKYSITYDLWEEKYYVRIENSDSARTVSTTERKELINIISNVSTEAFLQEISLKKIEASSIKLKIIYNPIAKQKLEEIKAWIDSHDIKEDSIPGRTVSATAGPAAGSSPHIGVQLSSNGPSFKKLFDRILEQRILESHSSAQWIGETKTILIDIPEPGYEQ